jgi:hypothetical protein
LDYNLPRTYSDILTFLLKKKRDIVPEWNTENPKDLGIALIELFAYIGDILNTSIDILWNESFIHTATSYASVYRIVRSFGYKPRLTSPAEGYVRFYKPLGIEVLVPKFTKVSDTDGKIVVYTLSDTVISEDEEYKDILCRNAEYEENELLAEVGGEVKWLSFTLKKKPVCEKDGYFLVSVSVNGEIWEQVPSFANSSFNDKHYVCLPNEDGSLTIQFGDGKTGKCPIGKIYCSYFYGGGSEGNVDKGILNLLLSNVSGIEKVENISPFYGGSDMETIEEMKVNFISWLRTIDRAVTLSDYEYLATRVSGILACKALSYLGLVILLPVSTSGTRISDEVKSNLIQFLEDKKMANTVIMVSDPVFVPVDLVIRVKLKPGYQFGEVSSKIKSEVEKYLSPIFNRDKVFGRNIRISDIYYLVEGVEGVEFSEIEMWIGGEKVWYGKLLDSDEVCVKGFINIYEIS